MKRTKRAALGRKKTVNFQRPTSNRWTLTTDGCGDSRKEPSNSLPRSSPSEESGVFKPSARLWDRAPQIFGGLNPVENRDLGIGDSFSVASAISHAAGKLRHLHHEALIIFTPVNNQFISNLIHPSTPVCI